MAQEQVSSKIACCFSFWLARAALTFISLQGFVNARGASPTRTPRPSSSAFRSSIWIGHRISLKPAVRVIVVSMVFSHFQTYLYDYYCYYFDLSNVHGYFLESTFASPNDTIVQSSIPESKTVTTFSDRLHKCHLTCVRIYSTWGGCSGRSSVEWNLNDGIVRLMLQLGLNKESLI